VAPDSGWVAQLLLRLNKFSLVAPDLGWVAHLLVRLQSVRLQSPGSRFGLGSPFTYEATIS